jgi:hypothetical protein
MAASTETYYDSQTVVFTIATNSPTLTNSPTPTRATPELSALMILPLLLSVFFVAVILRHQKQARKARQVIHYLSQVLAEKSSTLF